MPETVQTARAWGTIQPDTRYDLGSVDVRFEVPLGCSFEMMKVLAEPEIRRAIDQFERLGHWKHYDKIPIRYDVSAIARPALDRLNQALMYRPEMILKGDYDGIKAMAADAFYSGTVSMVATVWFVRPLIAVNLDEERERREQLGYADGFVPRADMPEGSLPNRAEPTTDD